LKKNQTVKKKTLKIFKKTDWFDFINLKPKNQTKPKLIKKRAKPKPNPLEITKKPKKTI
jgi:hypothetical protein